MRPGRGAQGRGWSSGGRTAWVPELLARFILSLLLLLFAYLVRVHLEGLSGGIVGGLLGYWLPSQPIPYRADRTGRADDVTSVTPPSGVTDVMLTSDPP